MENGKVYTFDAFIEIEAQNEDEAISLFRNIRKMLGVTDLHCYDWKEIE